MLKDDFFTITGKENGEGLVVYHIELNPNHPIFRGHFPGNPISPGVCNIGMIKVCAEEETGSNLFIGNLKQCKFSHLVTPGENKELDIVLKLEDTGDIVKIAASIIKGDTKFMELKAEASKEQKA